MKTLSWRFKVFLVVAIALTGFLSWRAFAKKPETLSGASVHRHWNANKLKPEYQDDDGTKFKALLDANEAIYCIKYKKNDNAPTMPHDNGGCKTVSSASVDAATRELVLICGGAHVTQQAGFGSTPQATNVDAAFQ